MHQIGANGINGTLYDSNGSVMILINNGELVGKNAYWNGWNSPPRPVIYFDGKLNYVKVKTVKELPSDVFWAVGGGSLPFNQNENWGPDVVRKAERTAMAIKDDKVYLIATHEKLSLEELGDKIKEQLDPDHAIFLDGGGSTQMFYDKAIITSSRTVDNGIFVKE